MNNSRLYPWLKWLCVIHSITWVSSARADAADLPFNSTMNLLKDAITGPFLLSVSIIMIVVTCLMLAFGEWGDGFKKLINIVLWLSIAFSASSFVTTLFGN